MQHNNALVSVSENLSTHWLPNAGTITNCVHYLTKFGSQRFCIFHIFH